LKKKGGGEEEGENCDSIFSAVNITFNMQTMKTQSNATTNSLGHDFQVKFTLNKVTGGKVGHLLYQ